MNKRAIFAIVVISIIAVSLALAISVSLSNPKPPKSEIWHYSLTVSSNLNNHVYQYMEYEDTTYIGLNGSQITFLYQTTTGTFGLVKIERTYVWSYIPNMALRYKDLTFYNVTVDESGTMDFYTTDEYWPVGFWR